MHSSFNNLYFLNLKKVSEEKENEGGEGGGGGKNLSFLDNYTFERSLIIVQCLFK